MPCSCSHATKSCFLTARPVCFELFLVLVTNPQSLQVCPLDHWEPPYHLTLQILLDLKDIQHALCKYAERKLYAEVMRVLDESSDVLPSQEMVINP